MATENQTVEKIGQNERNITASTDYMNFVFEIYDRDSGKSEKVYANPSDVATIMKGLLNNPYKSVNICSFEREEVEIGNNAITVMKNPKFHLKNEGPNQFKVNLTGIVAHGIDENKNKIKFSIPIEKYKIDDKHYALTNRQIGQKGTEEFLHKAVEIVGNINQARYDVWEEVSNGEKGEFTEEQKKMYGEKMASVKEENPNNFNVTLEERFTKNGEPYFVTANVTYIEPKPEITENSVEKKEQTQPQNEQSFGDVEEQNKKIDTSTLDNIDF